MSAILTSEDYEHYDKEADVIARTHDCQHIPNNLFTLVTNRLIDHEEFFVLAEMKKRAEVSGSGEVVLAAKHVAERTGLTLRTATRRITSLVEKQFLARTMSDIRSKNHNGTRSWPVNKYVIRWDQISAKAAMLRRQKKESIEPDADNEKKIPRSWRRCWECGSWIDPRQMTASERTAARNTRHVPVANDKALAAVEQARIALKAAVEACGAIQQARSPLTAAMNALGYSRCVMSQRIAGPCHKCGQHTDAAHLPNGHTMFCDRCCPECSRSSPLDSW